MESKERNTGKLSWKSNVCKTKEPKYYQLPQAKGAEYPSLAYNLIYACQAKRAKRNEPVEVNGQEFIVDFFQNNILGKIFV